MPINDRPELPNYWPQLNAYNHVRERVYHGIIADTHIAQDALILDAACGDAFYSRLLSRVLGCDARIVAIDNNPRLLRLHRNDNPSIQLCIGDVEQAAIAHHTFDAIWLHRTMHSVSDPVQRLSSLARLLRPGGKLIVIENDLAHYPILSWPVEIEHDFHHALYELFTNRCEGKASVSRYYAARHLPDWLTQIGMREITARTYAVEDVAPMSYDAEAYWRLYMTYLGDGIKPYLASDVWQAYAQAFDPQSPHYLLNQPGFYALELISVVCGIAP
jgi:ubiquinone/menaquinone biosynthesis C-methylase UbiE